MFWKNDAQYTDLQQLIYQSEDTLYVGQDDFKSSNGRFLLSEGFSRCNGLVFFDPVLKKGALAHISDATTPEMLVKGEVGNVVNSDLRRVERLSDCFSQLERVICVNIYHSYAVSWWPEVVDTELRDTGIKNILHIPLTTISDNSCVVHRAIAIDIKRKEVYIFPNNNTSLIKISLEF